MKMVTNLRVQLCSVRASEENCKPILLRGTADCFDCSSGQCNGSCDYVRAVHPIDGENGLAAASARATSFQSLASKRPRLGGARDLLARSTTMRARAGVTMFLFYSFSVLIVRRSSCDGPLDDKLTPLTHGCSRRFEDRRRVHQAYKDMAAIARRGSCAAGAPKKPPLGRRVLCDRARIQRPGAPPSPMEQLDRRRVPMVRAAGSTLAPRRSPARCAFCLRWIGDWRWEFGA